MTCTDPPRLDGSIREHLGEQLRSLYGDLIGTSLPRDLAALTKRLERAVRARSDPPDPEFINSLLECAPHLRAYALSLTRSRDQAEDLVQDTLLRACANRASFEPGTNLNAWLFTILRNAFHSEYRKRKWEVDDEDGSHAASLIYWPDQMPKLELQDLSVALSKLPVDQREALLLVAAEGMSYEDVAIVVGVPVGTVKSRVSRARHRLVELMGMDERDVAETRLAAKDGGTRSPSQS